MAARVDIYWPRAEVVNDDGSVCELKTDEGYTALFSAVLKVSEWEKEYGAEKLKNRRIEVRGANNRRKRTITVGVLNRKKK